MNLSYFWCNLTFFMLLVCLTNIKQVEEPRADEDEVSTEARHALVYRNSL